MTSYKKTESVDLSPEAIRTRLTAFMNEHGRSAAEVARSIGKSGSVLSQWLQDKYTGDNDAVAALIDSYLTAEYARILKPENDFPFVMIPPAEDYFNAANIAHSERAINVVIAHSGRGKTWAGRNYAKLNPGVVFFESRVDEKPQSFFSRLCQQFKLPSDGTPPKLEDLLIDTLHGTGRLLIIDEAEQLNGQCLERVRRLWDMTGIGVLLAGMPRLFENMKGRRRESQEQIYSRVLGAFELPEARVEDFAAILAAVKPEYEEFADEFHQGAGGSLRSFSNIYRIARTIAYKNDTELSRGIIRKAKSSIIL